MSSLTYSEVVPESVKKLPREERLQYYEERATLLQPIFEFMESLPFHLTDEEIDTKIAGLTEKARILQAQDSFEVESKKLLLSIQIVNSRLQEASSRMILDKIQGKSIDLYRQDIEHNKFLRTSYVTALETLCLDCDKDIRKVLNGDS